MTIRSYILGFVLSVALTLLAFGVVWQHLRTDHVSPSHDVALPLLILLALGQLVVQMVCFLHLGRERKPHWNFVAFAFAIFVVAVVVGGSLWIMGHLQHQSQDTSHIW